jgi:threonine dehydratase
MTIGLAEIEAAAGVLAGHVVRTPCLRSERLSEVLGAEITLKLETLQHSSSFKDRGALVKLASLGPEERARGVIAMSAGNHAQGVAYHATRLGIPATIVMPRLTPSVKVEKTRQFGARVLLEGDSVDEAAVFATRLAKERDLTFIHPFDDPLVIAGQGTIGLEMLADAPEVEMIVAPIGGGGLIAGVATAIKAIRPEVEVIGAQAAACPSMQRRRAGLPEAPARPTLAEGIEVKRPGRLTLPIVQRLVSDVLLVEEEAIEEAILALLEVEKTVIEGAGAVALAAVMSDRARFASRRVGVVLSGGNIDLRVLSAVILRGLVRSRRLIRIEVDIADAPGSLARVAALIGEAGGNIVEVEHQRAFSALSVKSSEVYFTIETRNAAHATDLVRALRAAGFGVRSLDEPGAGRSRAN